MDIIPLLLLLFIRAPIIHALCEGPKRMLSFFGQSLAKDQELQKWAESRGVHCGSIVIGRDGDGMRGLFAAKDIMCEDALLLSIPAELCFYTVNTESEWQLEVGLQLLEAMKDSSSDMRTYISTLPSPSSIPHLPWRWIGAMDCGGGLWESLSETYPELTNLSISQANYRKWLSYEARARGLNPHDVDCLQHCIDLIQTRNCKITFTARSGKEKAVNLLVPVFDMMNHKDKPNAYFCGGSGSGGSSDLDQGLDGCSVLVKAVGRRGGSNENGILIEKGEPICISYGDLTSENGLANYGFDPMWGAALEDRSMKLSIPVAALLPQEELLARSVAIENEPQVDGTIKDPQLLTAEEGSVLSLLRGLDLLDNDRHPKTIFADGISQALLVSLRIAVADIDKRLQLADELKVLQGSEKASSNHSVWQKSITKAVEVEALSVLLHLLHSRRGELGRLRERIKMLMEGEGDVRGLSDVAALAATHYDTLQGCIEWAGAYRDRLQ